MERLYGLLGWPVGHSVSPAMMAAAFQVRGIDGHYLPFAVPAEQVQTALAGLAALGAGGVNVTIPHKRTVYQLVDERTVEAELAGAVNTVRFDENGRTIGHNTDIVGWWNGLKPHLPERLRRVCILGAGGAARAAVAALAHYAPGCEVVICARDRNQREALAAQAAKSLRSSAVDWSERQTAIAAAELVTNATSIGMWPREGESPVSDGSCFSPGQVVQDMVYRPRQTQLLQAAARQGAITVDGLYMLVGQGAAAFEFWTGETAPIDEMMEAAERALGGRT